MNPDPDEGGAAVTVSADIRANRYDVLSRLAEDLAHEIKNPLNAIVVNLEVLRRRVASGAADAALDRAAVIEHEVRRVNSLVEQLLHLLRPARREAAAVAIDSVLEALAPVLEIQAKAARVPFTCDYGSSLFAQVRPDPLKFALLNLAGYAIDAAARAGGAVVIEAKRAGTEIYVVVSCSGAVMRPDDEVVNICRTLLASAGGTLESVEPAPAGAGSTATLVLPPGNFA